MEIVPRLIRDYNLVLYAVCFITFAYFAFTAVSALRELRRATFRLERQMVTNRATSAAIRAMMCIVAAAAVYFVSGLAPSTALAAPPGVTANTLGQTAPTRPPNVVLQPTSLPTAQLPALAATTLTPQPASRPAAATAAVAPPPAGPTAAVNPPATPTTRPTAPAPTAAPTIVPSPTPAPSPTNASKPASAPAGNCAGDAVITNPQPGEKVSGRYAVRGFASVQAPGYYKLEVLVPGAAQWSFIMRGDQSVGNGVLTQGFDFNALAPGPYPLRLVIVRPDYNIGAICQVPIVVGQ